MADNLDVTLPVEDYESLAETISMLLARLQELEDRIEELESD